MYRVMRMNLLSMLRLDYFFRQIDWMTYLYLLHDTNDDDDDDDDDDDWMTYLYLFRWTYCI